MSTRSRIGIELADKTIKSIYCHFDGYFNGVGATLLDHYTNRSKVEQLIALGSISVLGEEIGEKHDFERHSHSDADPQSKWTLAYGRDREESDTEATTQPSRREFLLAADQSGGEYAYLFTLSDEWVACEDPGPSSRLTKLTKKRCTHED